MNAEAIQYLDGPTLTRMAWDLDLVPRILTGPNAGQPQYRPRQREDEAEHYYDSYGAEWRPWEVLSQADAVFRGLRERGWHTRVMAYTAMEGMIFARHPLSLGQHYMVFWGEGGHGEGETPEALALLRAAILAVASSQEVP